ncbi:MAG: hypothetical protein K8T10_16050 [Candidatus Eremiobacteraeota bacterium]|nr:hypothetical protein [Candidatus Eremiobacteraeota bacterium]
MSRYAAGIGGTGARCLEALTYACAAGLFGKSPLLDDDGRPVIREKKHVTSPEIPKIIMTLIDQNVSCGNIERTLNLISLYRSSRDIIDPTVDSDFFSAEVELYKDFNEDEVWKPVAKGIRFREYIGYDDAKNQLSSLIGKPGAKDEINEISKIIDLIELFYSEEELNINLEEGFVGKAKVGSTVMALQCEKAFDKEGFFAKMVDEIEGQLSSGQVRMFIFASIFGGMGASGFPTFGSAIRKKYTDKEKKKDRDFSMGGALLLPYFWFDTVMGGKGEVDLKSTNFTSKAKEALKYYYELFPITKDKWEGYYNSLYFIGDDKPRKVKQTVKAGAEQRNPSHYCEFLSSLAAIHFLKDEEAHNKTYFSTRDDDVKAYFGDLPANKFLKMQERLLHFTTFAKAFKFYYDVFQDSRFETYRKNFKWFHQKYKDLNKEKLKPLKEFVDSYLAWLEDVNTSDDKVQREYRMFSNSTFQEEGGNISKILFPRFVEGVIDEHKFANPQSSIHIGKGHINLLELMNNMPGTREDDAKSAESRFIKMLFKACKHLCKLNYKELYQE